MIKTALIVLCRQENRKAQKASSVDTDHLTEYSHGVMLLDELHRLTECARNINKIL